MFTAAAVVRTEHAERYLARLGGHVAKMGRHWGHRLHGHGGRHKPPEVRHMEWSATRGTVRMDWGSWTVQAAAGTLRLRAEAVDETSLRHGAARIPLRSRAFRLVIWAVYALVTGMARKPGQPDSGGQQPGDARRILGERLARGQIDAEEYRRLRGMLGNPAGRSQAGTGFGSGR